MTKHGFFRSFVLIAVSGWIIAASFPAPGGKQEQGQEGRPKFYASRVVSEKDVKNPKEALAEPDGRYAEIAPGGQMVLLMEKLISPSATFDDGLVVCQAEASFGLEGWFLQAGTEAAPQYAWMPLFPGKSPGGFRLMSQDMIRGTLEGSPGVNIIRISNNDAKPMLLDAVVGFGRAERSREMEIR